MTMTKEINSDGFSHIPRKPSGHANTGCARTSLQFFFSVSLSPDYGSVAGIF